MLWFFYWNKSMIININDQRFFFTNCKKTYVKLYFRTQYVGERFHICEKDIMIECQVVTWEWEKTISLWHISAHLFLLGFHKTLLRSIQSCLGNLWESTMIKSFDVGINYKFSTGVILTLLINLPVGTHIWPRFYDMYAPLGPTIQPKYQLPA